MNLDGVNKEILIREVMKRLGLRADESFNASGIIPGLLPDGELRRLSNDPERPMISPFSDKLSGEGMISHGCSSYGYDATLGTSFKLFTNSRNEIIDPKNFSAKCYDEFEEDKCFIMPPHSFVLCHTLEYFKMPKDVLSICLGKSTYARCGLIVNVTPLEPGWEGQVTIEISNTTPNPAMIYPLEGICQFLFLRSGAPCETSYDARGGKYMGQKGVVDPKVLALTS